MNGYEVRSEIQLWLSKKSGLYLIVLTHFGLRESFK
jgi:hypothetical protein